MASQLSTDAEARFVLEENGPFVRVPSILVDAKAVAEANERWREALRLRSDPLLMSEQRDGSVGLRADGVTGVVRVGKVDIEIVPKFLNGQDPAWQKVLWRILAVVEGGHIDPTLTDAQFEGTIHVPDLLADIFLRSYDSGAARGLPRGYLARGTQGKTLRGSLDLSRLSSWLAQPWELPYVTDELTDDTPLARLLRWTASCLAGTVSAPGRTRALTDIASNLAHVDRRPPHLLDARRLSLGVQHRGLEPAWLVGLLLLEGAGVNYAAGDHGLSGFLWNSDVIYENYVYSLCRAAAAKQGLRVHKMPVRFGEVVRGEGTRLQTTPDVVFQDSTGNLRAVLDSKYKRLGGRPVASDTYQIFAAGHILGCQNVALIFPVSKDREMITWTIRSRLGGRVLFLSALSVNLMKLADPYQEATLIEQIESWLNMALT